MVDDPVNPDVVDVGICDARPFDRLALAALCAGDPGLRVTASTADPEDLLLWLQAKHRAVVILIGSNTVRDRHGIALIDQLHHATPRPRVLLVGTDADSLPSRAQRVHADGYLVRAGEADDQLTAINPGW